MTRESSIALLIDADNCPAAKIEQILDELARFGVINIRRAYGNWKSTNLRSWEEVLQDYAIQPMQQFAYTKGKNATDAAMIIDAMDLLYARRVDAFGLASSDSDFAPLVTRIRADGLEVIGFGEKKTPMAFVNVCSRFLYLENLGLPPKGVDLPALESSSPAPVTPVADAPVASPSSSPNSPAGNGVASPLKPSVKELRGNTRLVNLLRNAVEAAADDEGWAGLVAVGSHISKQTSFDARNYGYAKLSDLILAIGLFEVIKRNKGIYVRDKRQIKKRPVPQYDAQ